MKKTAYLLASLICVAPTISFAGIWGTTLSLPVYTKEPPDVRGFQMMFSYDPQIFRWRKFNIYFDGGYTYFYQTSTPYNQVINIYSLAPVIHYNYRSHGPITPYIELSIGVAYLNRTHFEDRKLGIHFAFQDRAGFGILFGKANQFSVGVHCVHYSNAHLSAHNSGISLPMELDLGYRFT